MRSQSLSTLFDFDWGRTYGIGFEDVFKRLETMASSLPKTGMGYPPYNIRKLSDNEYIIELAVAGFTKNDLDLTLEDGVLKVTGHIKNENDSNSFIFKGIAERAFTRSFTLADSIEIKNTDLANGMLRIWLENIIPESKKPKKININSKEDGASRTGKKEFLSENKD